MFEDSFLLQFQQLCGAIADFAVTGLRGYSSPSGRSTINSV